MKFPDGSYLLDESVPPPPYNEITWAKAEIERNERLRTMLPPDPNESEPEYPLTPEQNENLDYFEKHGCWPEEHEYRDSLIRLGVKPVYANGMAQRRALMRIGVDPDRWAALRVLPF